MGLTNNDMVNAAGNFQKVALVRQIMFVDFHYLHDCLVDKCHVFLFILTGD